jgi:hypothetical protein
MKEAGLPEPCHRLTEKPDHVPQWCSKHWLTAGHRKGGGELRRASWHGRLFDVHHGRGGAFGGRPCLFLYLSGKVPW